MPRGLLLVSMLLLFSLNFHGQNQGLCKKFNSLSRPEKWWVIKHPFIAKEAWNATQEAKKASKEQLQNKRLDGQESGGQVDAFRHSYWMALLVREMKEKKALRLGKAHEKANYLDFKKHRKEDGLYPDKASMEMDLFNNKIGSEIGLKYNNMETDSLQNEIISYILRGNMKIISRDSLGNFLNCRDEAIPDEQLKNIWDNGKCLINSDYSK